MERVSLTMKNKVSFCTSLLLVVALLTPVLCLAASAANKIPVINIIGERAVEVWKEDGTHYEPTGDAADAVVDGAVQELVPLFIKAVLTNNYDEWSRKALEKLTPIYDEIRPNPDGSLPENTGIYYAAVNVPTTEAQVPAPEQVNSYYPFAWDYRLSPLDAADQLKTYIGWVKAKTGSDKVVIVSRCGSTSLPAAYLYKYGTADIEKLIFACSTLPGVSYADTLLSGNVYISGDALYNRVSYRDDFSSLNENLRKFLSALLYAMAENGGMDDANGIINYAYGKIKDSFVAPFLRSYYGICGNYVASVGDHYDDYRDYVFPTDELKAEYAAILAKTDEYHYNVQAKIRELLTAAAEDGVSVNFIVTYGEPTDWPIGENSSRVGDELMDANAQSLGATAVNYGETLPDAYVAAREAQGLGGFISPDHQIDASTCLFPETTWFIKNMRHAFFENDLHDFIRMIAWTDDFTVDSDPDRPRFLTVVGDHAGLAPAAAENENDLDPAANRPDMHNAGGFFARIIAFYAKLISRIFNFFHQFRIR